MFKRLIVEDWMSVIPVIAFLLMFIAFVILSWRAIRMSRPQREHMAHLPFADETPPAAGDSQTPSAS